MSKLVILQALLVTQMNHWVVYTIGITILGVAGSDELYIAQFMLLGLLPFAFYLIRHYTDKFIAFMAYHALAAGGAAVLLLVPMRDNSVSVIVFSLYIFIYFVLSSVVRVMKKDRLEGAIHPVAATLTLLSMMLIQQYQGRIGLDSYYLIALIVYIGLFFIYYYHKYFLRFISESDSAAGLVPERAIYRTGISLVGLFTVIVLVIVLPLTQFSTPPVELPATEIEMPAEEVIFTQVLPDFQLPPEDSYNNNPGTQNRTWVYPGIAILIILLAGLAIFGFVMLMRLIGERFALTLEKKARELDLEVDVREKVDVVKTKTDTESILAYFSPRERIRRIFKKRVLDGKGFIVGDGEPSLLNKYTAHECRQVLGDRVPASIYDKARYSDMECSAQDVKAARRM